MIVFYGTVTLAECAHRNSLRVARVGHGRKASGYRKGMCVCEDGALARQLLTNIYMLSDKGISVCFTKSKTFPLQDSKHIYCL